MHTIKLCFSVSVFTILLMTSVVSLEFQCVPLENCSCGMWLQSHKKFLRSVQCGYDENGKEKVWCKKDIKCSTPDDRNGICMSAIECDNLNQNFVEKTPCHNHENLVCCSWIPAELSSVPRPNKYHWHHHHHQGHKFGKRTRKPKNKFNENNTGMSPDQLEEVCKKYVLNYVATIKPKVLPPKETQCGRQVVGDRIPWSALLGSENGRIHCGGVIISKRFILTSAQCLFRKRNFLPVQRVILGEFPIQSFGVEKIIVHERFNFNPPIHDIGLVKVDRDISFSDSIQPTCLTDKSFLFKKNDTFLITSWKNSKFDFPIQLKTTLKLTKKADCSQISIGQICLAGQEIDCAGGYGGSVIKNTTIAGETVTSLIGLLPFSNICEKNASHVATSIPFYIDWIKEKLGQN